MLRVVAISILLAAGAATADVAAQASPPPSATAAASALLEAGEGRAVAQKLADELVASFVYRDKAEDYAAMLRKNAAAGRYDKGTRDDLAKLLTDDLQAVHKDGHLHVMLTDPSEARAGPGHEHNGPPKGFPPLVQSAKTIAPGVGYIRFTAFMGAPEEMAAVRKWLAENRDDKVLIFDLRNHHGGGLDEQDAIFSYLYSKKTPLVKMAVSNDVYKRSASPLEAGPTLVFASEGTKDGGDLQRLARQGHAASKGEGLSADLQQDRVGGRAFLARAEVDRAGDSHRRADRRSEPFRRRPATQ